MQADQQQEGDQIPSLTASQQNVVGLSKGANAYSRLIEMQAEREIIVHE